MVEVEYIQHLNRSPKIYIDPRDLGLTQVLRKEHPTPGDYGKTNEDFERVKKEIVDLTFTLKFDYSDHVILFEFKNSDLDPEEWKDLVQATQNPEGTYTLSDYDSSIRALNDDQIEFWSGGITFYVPKEISLEAFQKVQADTEKYPNTGFRHSQIVHNSNGADWIIIW